MMDEAMDQEVNTTTDTISNTNNFTQIQSRKYRSTTTFPCYKLCPSMDLLILGSSSSSTTANTHSSGIESDNNIYSKFNNSIAEVITVHRIISWNSLLSLKIDELTSGPKIGSNSSSLMDREGGGLCVEDIERDCTTERKRQVDNDDDDMDVEEEGLIKGATSVCWSPNGRYVAIGLVDGGVLLHTVEPDAAAEASSSSVQHHHDGGASGTGTDGNDSALMHIIRPPPPNYTNKPSLLSPTAGSSAPAGFGGVTATNEDSSKKKKNPTISPRVTRSMRASREGGGGTSSGGAGSAKSRRSKSPGGNRRPNLKVDVKNSLQSTAVIGMVWNRLLPIQQQQKKKLNKDDGGASLNYEQEVRETWKYSSQLIDRGAYFLPSSSKPPSGGTSSGSSGSMNLFSSMAHLNVLCVATPEEIHWYLQGQYRILSIPHGLEGCSSISGGGGVDLVCSPDLSTLLAVTKQATSIVSTSPKKMRSSPKNHGKSMKAKLFNTYLLPEKRFELQVLSASYKSIFTHLWDVQTGIQSALSSWKSALRPLDNKFKGLLQLLAKYSLDNTGGGGGGGGSSADSIRLEFLRFILSGRSTVSSNTSSALDQFFTRAQMHDQLLQREIRGIEASVAAMESSLRSHVLSSIRAVVYEAEELYGLAKAQQTSGSGSSSSNTASLTDANTALCLYNASRILFLTFDQCLGYVVEARTRLHDLLSWIRSTASQVRAWGTATDSIQRKNARSRRVSNGVVQRVAAFLSNPMLFTLNDGSSDKSYQTLTECVLGVPLSDFFVMGNSTEKELHTIADGTKPIRSIKSALQTMMQISTILFDKPRNVLAQSLTAIDISFEAQHTIMSIHTRIGAGANASSSSYCAQRGETSGFFLPKTPQEEDDETISNCPYWTLLARSLGPNQVELIAIPGSTSFEQEDVDDGFYLRSEVMIPEGYEVTNIAFYGDDGNSSLSPDLNEESKVKEGRQSVGFVIKYIDSVSQEVREELWLFQYDDITFQRFKSKRNEMKNEFVISATAPNEEECTFLTISDVEDNVDRHCIAPKRRHICTHRRNDQVHQQSQVNLCGSRGTGGVITFDKSTYLNIFDLEEDEENDSV